MGSNFHFNFHFLAHGVPTQTMDPGEALLIATGVTPYLDGDPPRMTLKLLEETARLPKQLKEQARAALGSLPYRAAKQPSYDTLKGYFDQPLDSGYVQQVVSAFPDEAQELAVPFSTALTHAIEYLRSLFPRSTYETFTGPRPLTPDDERNAKFRFKLAILDKPMQIFPLISCGGLLQSQVECLEQVMPTFLEAVRGEMQAAITEKLMANIKYLVPPRLQLGLSTLTGRMADVHAAAPPPKPPGTNFKPMKPNNQNATQGEKASEI